MRAISIKHPGSVDVLEQIEVPVPKPKTRRITDQSPYSSCQSNRYYEKRISLFETSLPYFGSRSSWRGS